jgi:hypothetical protein
VVEFGDHLDLLIAPRKPGFAFRIGATGSPRQNFMRTHVEGRGTRVSSSEFNCCGLTVAARRRLR